MSTRNHSYTRLLEIPETLHKRADKRAIEMDVLHNSHRKLEANQVGCLGEVVAEYWMDWKQIQYAPELSETTHDYRLSNNMTLDVKTKDRTVLPKIHFDNSVPLYNHDHQAPDYFLFISLYRDSQVEESDIRRFKHACIIGSISYQEMNEIGVVYSGGQEDSRNGTKFWTDCLNVEMGQLVPLNETVELFKGLRDHPSQKGLQAKKYVVDEA